MPIRLFDPLKEIALRQAAKQQGQPCRNAQRRRGLVSLALEGSGECVANPGVDAQQLLASNGHRTDAHDRDQRGN